MFDEIINAAASTYNVPVPWIQAVIETESSWNPDAYNPNDPSGAWGLMQILFTTAKGLGYGGTAEGLFDPETNINLGSKLLGMLRDRYGDDFRRVYSAYNSGNPDLWETSSQVGANVRRALTALQKWIDAAVGVVTQSPASAGVVVLLGFVLFWAWTTKGRHK